MRPRWRKVFSDLIDNKLRTALVVFSIAVGVFAIGMITGAYVIIDADMGASYAANKPMNVELRTNESFSSEIISTVESMRGVEDVEARRVFAIRARVPGSQEWIALNMVTVDDYKKIKIGLLTPISGASAPLKKQVLLEKKALKSLNVPVGAQLEFQLPDGTIKSMPMVGVVQDQTTAAGDFLAAPLVYITRDTLNYMAQPDIFNRMYVTVTEGKNDSEHLRQMSAAIKDKIEKANFTVSRTRVSKSNEHPLATTIQAVLSILLALGILVLFLSGSLIANTISALLSQHLRHIGVMKLIGARRNQIFSMYIALILSFALIALLIAIPLGGQGAYGLALLIADQVNFSLSGYRLVPLALVVQLIVGVAVPLFAGYIPVLNGSRITVLRAVNGDTLGEQTKAAGGKKRESLFERVENMGAAALLRRGIHLPRPLLISLRNTFRRRGRLMLTLFTLTMGGAVFISVFNVRATLFDFIGSLGNYFKADVTVTFNEFYRLDKVKLAGMRFPGVTQVEGWGFANAEVLFPDKTVAENLVILAPPVGSKLVQATLVSGRWLQAGDEKAITVSESIFKNFPNLKANDVLRLKVNGKEDDWKVVGIFKFVQQQGTIAYGTYEYLSRLTHEANRAISYRIMGQQHDDASQTALAAGLDSYFRKQGFHVTEARSGKSTLAAAAEGMNILVGFLLVMALLTASVGSMGLAGTMGMNVLERTREIGIMRSIGAVDREIMRTVIVEGVVIGSISWVLGAILSVPFTYLLSTIVSVAVFDSPVEVHFTPIGFFIWLAVVLVLSALASVLPARNAAQLTIREVLAYE
jgi:putative ABC transport system permease protein